jgi:hypothetical protein
MHLKKEIGTQINTKGVITLRSCRGIRRIMMIRKFRHLCRTITLKKIRKLKM